MTNLIRVNWAAYRYYLSVLPEFNRICEPLYKIGVKGFGYRKIFKDGRYLALDNNPDYRKRYFQSAENIGSHFTEQVKEFSTSKYVYDIVPNDISKYHKTKDYILHLMYEHNMWNIMTILKYSKQEYCEAYNFYLDKRDIWNGQFYIENLSLLKRFLKYFNYKASEIIDCTDQSKLAYYSQTFDFQNRSEDVVAQAKIKEFLEETRLRYIKPRNQHEEILLTPREAECIQYMLSGYSMKCVADILDLSPRTVEYYLSNAKNKTGYSNKNDLLRAFAKSNQNE